MSFFLIQGPDHEEGGKDAEEPGKCFYLQVTIHRRNFKGKQGELKTGKMQRK